MRILSKFWVVVLLSVLVLSWEAGAQVNYKRWMGDNKDVIGDYKL